MRILKVFLKFLSPPIQCCKPIILPDASFTHCFSTLFRRARGEKHKIDQIAVFPIIFVPYRLKILQNFKCGFFQLLILNQIEGIYLPITSLLHKFLEPKQAA